MKRFIILLGLLLICNTAHAGLISLSKLSEDASIGDINSNFDTLEDTINGGIESDNITDDTLDEATMADEINPRVRYDETFNNWTVSGMLPATSASTLISDVSAGISYVDGFRISLAATSKTYTASKDTWVYIKSNGDYQYKAVANGSSQPATDSGSLLLAKVVTDADNITGVTDYRVLTPSSTIYENFTIKGLYVLSSDTQAVSIDPGIVYAGTTRIVKTAVLGLRTTTASDWWDGNADSAATAWWYMGVKSTGDVKWLGANPPNRHNISAGTEGTLYYWYDGTDYWRVIGLVRMNAGGFIDHMVQQGDTYFHGLPVSLTTTVSDAAWKKLACDAGIPPIATKGIFGLAAADSNNEALILIRPLGTTWGGITNFANGIGTPTGGGSQENAASGQRICITRTSADTTQVIEYLNHTSDNVTEVSAEGFIVNLRD